MSNIETRIADALNDKDAKPAAISDLIRELDEEILLNEKEQEATRARILDIRYENAAIAKSALEKLVLLHDRYRAALPVLLAAYSKAEHRARLESIRPRYDDIAARRTKCFETLFKLYNNFLENFVPVLKSTAKLNADIRRLNSETSGLQEFKIIPTIAEPLLERLVLPAERGNYWPDERAANALASQWGDVVAQTYTSSPLRQAAASPDWAAARAIQDEAKKAEWARINALQERQQAEAKREFEQSKKVAR